VLRARLLTVFPGNVGTHYAAILLLNPKTGSAPGLDGRDPGLPRCAQPRFPVVVRHLARKDVSVLAILSSGVQARSHLESFVPSEHLPGGAHGEPAAISMGLSTGYAGNGSLSSERS
jgi:hypothetical protein